MEAETNVKIFFQDLYLERAYKIINVIHMHDRRNNSNMKNAFSIAMPWKQRQQTVRVLEASCSALLPLLRKSMEMQEVLHFFR